MMETGFKDAQLWASLNGLLPVLAESSPDEYLKALESGVSAKPSPFEQLFYEEGIGVIGRNYLVGVIWSLEVLAWRNEYLVRCAVLLSKLASMDPGGQWSNRPSNSLTTIFVPWFPQTMAPFERQFAAVKAVCGGDRGVGFDLLLSLLPEGHTMSFGSYEPKWLKLEEKDKSPKVSPKEYWQQVEQYADLALELAKEDSLYLPRLAEKSDHLPANARENFVSYLCSDEVSSSAPEIRRAIWEKLVSVISHHRQFPDAEWSMPEGQIEFFEKAVNALAPEKPQLLYRRLFIDDDYSLYENIDAGDWGAQRQKLQERRNEAVREIEKTDGLNGVLEFAASVDDPYKVGFSLGSLKKESIDQELFKNGFADENDGVSGFLRGFISGRLNSKGWKWVDGLDRETWSQSDSLFVLECLPFVTETWNRVYKWIGKREKAYWKSVVAIPHQADNLSYAAEKLLEAKRPARAVDCLFVRNYRGEGLDVEKSISALTAAITTSEGVSQHYYYQVVQLLEALQKTDSAPKEELIRLEWAYLKALGPGRRGTPKTLYRELAENPSFFCEVIRLVYRSKNEPKGEKRELSAEQEAMGSNAWHLLYHWKRPPGELDEGKFSATKFRAWLAGVVQECKESGHLEVALSEVGKVLLYCPEDKSRDLWIVKEVAEALDQEDYEEMRRGFTIGAFNSRGVHTVDPTGKEELKFADEWEAKAAAMEEEGFHRFAVELRGHAKHYARDARRIRNEYATDESENKKEEDSE